MFWLFGQEACGLLAPGQGLNPHPHIFQNHLYLISVDVYIISLDSTLDKYIQMITHDLNLLTVLSNVTHLFKAASQSASSFL